MNSKNHNKLSTTEPKKQKLSKQLEQEQSHRNGDHMELFTWRVISRVGEVREWVKKGTQTKKHNWQSQNRQGMLRIVQEMEKPKKLNVRPMDMN